MRRRCASRDRNWAVAAPLKADTGDYRAEGIAEKCYKLWSVDIGGSPPLPR